MVDPIYCHSDLVAADLVDDSTCFHVLEVDVVETLLAFVVLPDSRVVEVVDGVGCLLLDYSDPTHLVIGHQFPAHFVPLGWKVDPSFVVAQMGVQSHLEVQASVLLENSVAH